MADGSGPIGTIKEGMSLPVPPPDQKPNVNTPQPKESVARAAPKETVEQKSEKPGQPGERIAQIAEENPVPPGKPRDVLQKVADMPTEQNKTEKPEESLPQSDSTGKQETISQETADAATAQEKAVNNSEITKTMLKELNEALIAAKDVRAALVSLSLSTADNPMADEFRASVLESILNDENAKVPKDLLTKMKESQKQLPANQTDALQTFLKDHEIPTQVLEEEDASTVINSLVKFGKDKKLSQITEDLRAALWDEKTPMPKDVKELASLGSNPDQQQILLKMLQQNNIRTRLSELKSNLGVALFINFILLELMLSIIQQASDESQKTH